MNNIYYICTKSAVMDSNSERSERHENDLQNKSIKGVNMRSRTIVVSLPCDCLAAFEIVRISQQKWTCRETVLRLYGCHSSSQFRMEPRSLGSPTKPSDFYFLFFIALYLHTL